MENREFYRLYSSEKQCRQAFLEMRLQKGVTCKKCGGTEHYFLKSKHQFRCKNKDCKFETTLKSGTVLENSKLPFRKWFEAIFLMNNTKKGISSAELQRQLNLKYYEPALSLSQKIRGCHGKILSEESFESEYDLNNKSKSEIIDKPLDFKIFLAKEHRRKVTKIRLIQNDLKVAWEKICIRQKKFRNADPQPYLVTSQFEIKKAPYWLDTIISNATRIISGVHHHVDLKYQQRYLDEFCFKLNTRNNTLRWMIVLQSTV